ncbi:MAG TPA: hypothetical protein VGV93_02615, partial [Acidimicrobiales bacterium]|nr:hypothetical protein [Acidimicrobiales bacterium]
VHRARERQDRAGAQAGRSTFLHDHTFGVVDPAIQVQRENRKLREMAAEIVARTTDGGRSTAST